MEIIPIHAILPKVGLGAFYGGVYSTVGCGKTTPTVLHSLGLGFCPFMEAVADILFLTNRTRI